MGRLCVPLSMRRSRMLFDSWLAIGEVREYDLNVVPAAAGSEVVGAVVEERLVDDAPPSRAGGYFMTLAAVWYSESLNEAYTGCW